MNSFTRPCAGAAESILCLVGFSSGASAVDSPAVVGQRAAASADLASKPPAILVNHVGFTPHGAKYCLIAGNSSAAFEVIGVATGQAAFAGRTTPGGPDLGSFQVGDFSALTRPGTFQVRAGNARSGRFSIAPDACEYALRKTVSCFSKRRCGPSETGYNTPCHLDDGRRPGQGSAPPEGTPPGRPRPAAA